MKRIQYACLNQTILFKLKEDLAHDEAVSLVKAEYENYRKHLDRNNTPYKIVREETRPDGSILIQTKRQLNHYDVGSYLD